MFRIDKCAQLARFFTSRNYSDDYKALGKRESQKKLEEKY